MDREKEILSAFAEEMRRHNSVKRRINIIHNIIILGAVLLFSIPIILFVFFLAIKIFLN